MRPVLDMPLRRKIGLLVLVGLLGLFGLFSVLGLLLSHENARRTSAERLVIARLIVTFLDIEMEEQFAQLERAAAHAADVLDQPPGPRHPLSDLLRQPEPFIRNLFLTDREGRLLWSESLDASELAAAMAEHDHLRRPLELNARYVSGVHAMGRDERPMAVLAVPVRGPGGAPVAVLAAAIDPSHRSLRDLLSAAKQLGHTGHAELIDQHGLVIASTEPGHALLQAEHPDFYLPFMQQGASGVGTTEPIGDEDPAERGQRHVMAFVPLGTIGWGLLLGGSEAEFLAPGQRWLAQAMSFGGFSLVIALLLVWVTTRGVTRPLQALAAASRRIASGDLATPVPGLGEGEVRALAQAFDDMREHLRQALEALAVERTRYQAIVGSMGDAVFTTDTQFRMTAFNPAAEALTGWRADEVLGRSYFDVMRPVDEDGQAVTADLTVRVPASAGPCPAVAKETVRKRDGRPVVVAATRSAIHDRNGTVAGVVHVLRDVSAEEELSRLKDEFLATVSHELRTPLGYVKGYATTLLLPDAPQDEDTTRHCLQVIVEASDELQELVDNLLDMSKIGAGVLTVEPRPVGLGALARAAVERAPAQTSTHRLRVAIPARLPAVMADPRRIEQVLFNLVDNAIKYSPNGGQVTIAAAATETEVIVSVTDEGLGIPQEELRQLFERFHRGKSTRERHISGSGLGLAICKGIVEAHGGRIWIDSPAPGRRAGKAPGTVVRFTLSLAPRAAEPARRSRTRPAPTAPPRASRVEAG